MNYMFFLTPMLAKDGETFKPGNGANRYSNSQLALIDYTYKINTTFGDKLERITHKMYEKALGLCHVTVNHNLAKLRDDKILQRTKGVVNDYKINPDVEFSGQDYITVYNFLVDELGFNNATLLICFMLRHYFQVEEETEAAGKSKNSIKPEDAYFVGSKQSVAALLNIPESTARDAIKMCIDNGFIARKALYIDGDKEVICNGKGKSKRLKTVFILRTNTIRRAKKVHAQIIKSKEKHAKSAEKAALQAESAAARKDYRQHPKKAHKSSNKAEQRQRDYEILQSLYDHSEDEKGVKAPRGVLESWAPIIEKYSSADKVPTPFEEFDDPPPTGNKTK